ncbi:hypothetical protein PDESU_03857 [Pontiella desulfatans]|uniref:Uncharacterized protein n=1 Tax=Pontiella desulfatans TaxID=2750659 RepID=A0A6C2U5T7_PONDE|nr:hypothetical protein [Pontiella desulfatans]VGO15275.1 hypothetical protein PDESU_03857 [Pontiella desulfatans]
MKISQREMILGVATLAAGLAWLTWYIVSNKMDEYKAKATEIEKLERQISFNQKAIKMQEDWLGELNELQKGLRVFDTKQKSVAPELMKTIKQISDKHGMDITRNQPRSEKPIGDLFELAINCTWQSDLEAMVDFLAELQQQGVRYDVRTLNVKPVGNNTGKLGGNMLIHCAYTKKPNAGKK